MRQLGPAQVAGKRTISATARQLESLIRISEALAKMQLSDIVKEEHVIEALRLMRVAICEAATDPRTGQIDMDLITTGMYHARLLIFPLLTMLGRSQRARQSLKDLYEAVKEAITMMASNTTKVAILFQQIQSQASLPVAREDFDQVLKQLSEEDFISLTGAGGPAGTRNPTITRLF